VIETTTSLTSPRYSIIGPASGGRALGRDLRLERDVLLWVFSSPDPAERERIEALASVFARLTHPVFLQILDLVEDRQRVAIVLEAPAGGEQTAEHPLAGGLPALVAATLTLRIGAALEEAARLGLAVRELPLTYVHVSGADEVRLDPVGLLDETDDAYAGLVPLLTEFLASFLPAGGRAGAVRARFDPGADAAASFVGRWRERAARAAAETVDDMDAFLNELRLIAQPPMDFYVEEDAGFKRAGGSGITVAPAVPPDEEVTVPLSLPQAPPPRGPAPPRRGRSPRQAYEYDEYEPTTPVPRRQRASSGSRAPAIVGVLLIAALGIALVAIGLRMRNDESGAGAVVNPPPAASASPTPAPADRATLTVAAQQDARVRISVDGAVAFTGVLRAGESRSWEGGNRVQVWTDNGKHIEVTVNGFALGPLSAAVGHPDWNTVDWGWPAGWRPS
jgi:hypothetical protein